MSESLVAESRVRGPPGNHIGVRVQKAVINEACAVDARVALLEAVYVSLTIHVGRQMTILHVAPSSAPRSVPQRPQVVGSSRPIRFGGIVLEENSNAYEVSSFFKGKIAPLLDSRIA